MPVNATILHIKLSFLAFKWAVCDKFNGDLYGSKFTVRTDNNPLTYVLTTAKLNAAGHRWLAELSGYSYNFLLVNRARRKTKILMLLVVAFHGLRNVV